MIPTTVLGLLAFAASVGPGYVFVRITERSRFRPNRSALLELAELVTVGGFSSIVVLVVLVVVAHWLHWVDVVPLALNTKTYFAVHPVRVGLFVLAALGVSYLLAIGVALWIERGRAPSITHDPTWLKVLGDNQARRLVAATVELRDGRLFHGQVATFSVEEDSVQDRQLALAWPISQKVGADFVRTKADRLLLNARDIASIVVNYGEPTQDARSASAEITPQAATK